MNIFQIAVGSRIDNHDLMLNPDRRILLLLQDLHQDPAMIQTPLGVLVQIGSELGKPGQFSILGQFQTQFACNLLHGRNLGVPSYTGNRNTRVHRRTLAREEQLRFQEDLSVGNGNDVGGNVRRNVSRLGLDDRQRRNGTASHIVGKFGCPLQQPAVKVEHVAGISFSSGRPSQKQGHGPVSHGVLGQVVIDDQHVPALIHKFLGHGTGRIRSDILERSHFAGRCRNHDGIFHGSFVFQSLHQLGHSGFLLPDGHVYTDYIFVLLVDDSIDGDGGLTRLPVADNQLSLSPSDGNHGVDSLDTRLEGLKYGSSLQHAGRLALDRSCLIRLDGAFSVYGLAQRVDDPTDEGIAYGYLHYLARGFDQIPVLDFRVRAQDNDAYAVGFQIEGHAVYLVGKFQKLAGHTIIQSEDLSDAVAHLGNRSVISIGQLVLMLFDFLFNCALDGILLFLFNGLLFPGPLLYALRKVGEALANGGIDELSFYKNANTAHKGSVDPVQQSDFFPYVLLQFFFKSLDSLLRKRRHRIEDTRCHPLALVK